MSDRYFNFLVNKIGGAQGRCFTLLQIFLKEYVVTHKKDASIADAVFDMRQIYIEGRAVEEEIPDIESMYLTVLEILVILAEKMENDLFFQPGEERITRWFWEFIENLEIDEYFDNEWCQEYEQDIIYKLDKFVNREYLLNGECGNIFVGDWDSVYPQDYRKMSLWEQANQYASRLALDI